MKTRLVSLVFLALAACGRHGDEEDSTDVHQSALGTNQLACSPLTLEAGGIGSGQSASALSIANQTGTQDTWSRYVEFTPSTRAVCRFQMPAGRSTSELTLRVNYRGPSHAELLARFEAFDVQAQQWVLVTDNTSAADWRWSAQSVSFPGAPQRFIAADGTIRVRYLSGSQDATLLDQWVVQISAAGADAGLPVVDAGRPVPDAGTPRVDAGTPRVDAGTPIPDAGNSVPDAGSSGWWKPHPGTSWQWQLTGTLDTTVNATAFDIDLYETSASTISQLHASGRKVICYFDTAYEPGRPDSALLAPFRGNPIVGWPGQYWVDFRAPAVRDVMAARLGLAQSKGCDAVEPDDIDAIDNNPGFPLTAADQLSFSRFLATQAHARGLAIALKNNLAQIPQLVGDFDFALNEECFQYNECGDLAPFIAANKAVFHTEYTSGTLATKGAQICPKALALNFDTLIKHLDLDAARYSCR